MNRAQRTWIAEWIITIEEVGEEWQGDYHKIVYCYNEPCAQKTAQKVLPIFWWIHFIVHDHSSEFPPTVGIYTHFLILPIILRQCILNISVGMSLKLTSAALCCLAPYYKNIKNYAHFHSLYDVFCMLFSVCVRTYARVCRTNESGWK